MVFVCCFSFMTRRNVNGFHRKSVSDDDVLFHASADKLALSTQFVDKPAEEAATTAAPRKSKSASRKSKTKSTSSEASEIKELKEMRKKSQEFFVAGTNRLAAQGVPTELSQVLNSPRLRAMFRAYLKSLYASESLMFYETIELYESINKDTWRKRAGEGMIKKFVDTSGQYAVNISSNAREKLLALEKFEKDSFDDAKKELFDLMTTNFFAKFIIQNFDNGAANLAEYYDAIKRGMPRATEARPSNLAHFDV